MKAKMQGAKPVVDDGHKPPTEPLRRDNTENPSAQDLNLHRRACKTTWWIQHECGDPAALQLFEQVKRPRGGAIKAAQRLERALAAWCEADQTRKQLCALLAAQFQHQPETAQAAVDDLRLRVDAQCTAFAIAKFGETAAARAFGIKLGWAAWSALDIPQMTQARAALAILQERERALDQLKTDHLVLEAQMLKAQLSPELRATVAVALAEAATAADNDPVLELLRRFFAVKDGYWQRFFDQHGQGRKKKQPNFPTMRKRLVEILLAPEKLDWSPRILTLTRPAAHALAAICMKIAYPEVFPPSLDGESVRLALQYHEQMERRGMTERPRYNRV